MRRRDGEAQKKHPPARRMVWWAVNMGVMACFGYVAWLLLAVRAERELLVPAVAALPWGSWGMCWWKAL